MGTDETQMNATEKDFSLQPVTQQLIGAAFEVHNVLGFGFLEKVYENALRIELRAAGLGVLQQHPIPVRYKGEIVGEYCADLFVEGGVLVELKVCREFDEVHKAQCINYLKVTGLRGLPPDQLCKEQDRN